MSVINQGLSAATEIYATDILENQLSDSFSYHTIDHTRQVVKMVEEIGTKMNLSESELNLLNIAAWLHDLGYIRRYIGHEEESMAMARDFLSQQEVEEATIQQIESLIEATKLDNEPRNLLEEVIKDADLSNLALPEALENSEKIRQEWKIFCNRNFSNKEWNKFNYNFFVQHVFYTPYAMEKLEPTKQENIQDLEEKIQKKKKKKKKKSSDSLIGLELIQEREKVKKLTKKLEKTKSLSPDRGIETMFRSTYRTHIALSSIADNKANILLSVSSIVISIIFTSAIENYEDLSDFGFTRILPVFSILVVCMLTIVFAILALRPKVNSGLFTREDIIQKKTNLLFFGNFYSMDLQDYMWGIDRMMKDAEYLYGSMSKDIYFLGKVLARRFQLLRVAYNVFMYGMAIALLLLAIVFLLDSQGYLDATLVN